MNYASCYQDEVCDCIWLELENSFFHLYDCYSNKELL